MLLTHSSVSDVEPLLIFIEEFFVFWKHEEFFFQRTKHMTMSHFLISLEVVHADKCQAKDKNEDQRILENGSYSSYPFIFAHLDLCNKLKSFL
jgi:hypothetical protein